MRSEEVFVQVKVPQKVIVFVILVILVLTGHVVR